jgi:hypothetical protein
MIMKFGILAAAAALVMAASGAQAQSQSLIRFFGTANLEPLAGTPTLLNLGAQMDHRTVEQDVNKFDDFMLINGTGKKRVMFNRHLMNTGSITLGSWIGVAPFDKSEVRFDIQAGWEAVKAKYGLTNGVAHVIIYKTLNTSRIVYDYAVPIGRSDMECQEYLFTPNSGFQLGLKTGCWIGLSTTYSRRTSAGSGTRAQ